MGTTIGRINYQDGMFGNTISFVGNLGRDPEMSYTPNGKAKTTFSVAVWQGKDKITGKDKDALWLNCTAWEELAEDANVKLSKGQKVKCIGYLSSRKWEGKTYYDVTVSTIDIIIDDRVKAAHVDDFEGDKPPF